MKLEASTPVVTDCHQVGKLSEADGAQIFDLGWHGLVFERGTGNGFVINARGSALWVYAEKA